MVVFSLFIFIHIVFGLTVKLLLHIKIHSLTMPKKPLAKQKPKTPLALFRHKFLLQANGKRAYQSQLARDMEISTVRVQQLELGQAELPEKHALKLQEVYGISAEWLLAGDLKARPVTPEGKPYSRTTAALHRKVYQIRVGGERGPSASMAQNLAWSLEALLSEVRTAVIREAQDKGLLAAVTLFSALRDAVIQPLKAARPTTSIVSGLNKEATRLIMSTDRHERHRIDLTAECLGVEDLPIRELDGSEWELPEDPPDSTPALRD
jgi:plasmid maintenance system antidote protein VapI